MERRSLKRLRPSLLETCGKSGPFAPRALPRFLATTNRSDSRPRPPAGYGFPIGVALRRLAGSPRTPCCSVDARPPHSPRAARCVRLLVASASVAGFSTFGRLAAAIGFTRPNRVRNRWARAFALVACGDSPCRTRGRTDPFHVIGYPQTPNRGYMSNEQFTSLTPRSQQDQQELPWRNRRTEGNDDARRRELSADLIEWSHRAPRGMRGADHGQESARSMPATVQCARSPGRDPFPSYRRRSRRCDHCMIPGPGQATAFVRLRSSSFLRVEPVASEVSVNS
jgi:hypothetical protein